MITLAHKLTGNFGQAILLLDRFFLSVPALRMLDKLNADNPIMQIVTKAKRNCSAYDFPANVPGQRGRPRMKGATIKVFSLFETAKEQFRSAEARLYGKPETIRYHCVDLLWGKKLYKKLRFVLVEYNHTSTVLVSTDIALEPISISQLYGRRFGIEVMFREMKQVVDAFGYRFWSKYMPKLNRFKKKTDPNPLDNVTDPHAQKRIRLAIKAIEGFMFCSVVTAGLLQMISLRFSGTGELVNLRFLRTYRSATASEATVADSLRKNFMRLLYRRPNLPLNRIVSSKQRDNFDHADSDRAA
jgi:hypothetical protein